MGGEGVPGGFQLGAQLHEVVDLAVEHDDDAAVLVEHGLAAALQVDDGQPPMPQSYLLVHIKALAVRPAVGNQVCHLLDGLFCLFGVMLCTGKAHKSAHSAFLSARSVTQALVAEIAFVFAVIVQLVLGVPDGPLEGEVLLAEQLMGHLTLLH